MCTAQLLSESPYVGMKRDRQADVWKERRICKIKEEGWGIGRQRKGKGKRHMETETARPGGKHCFSPDGIYTTLVTSISIGGREEVLADRGS